MLFSRTQRKVVHGQRSSGTRRGKKQARRTARRLVLDSLEIRQLLCVSLPVLDEGLGSDPPGAVVAPPVEETPQNSPPVAVDDAYAMRGDQQLGANVLANDTDADGDTLAALLVAGPSHGTLVLDPAGPFTYKPERGFEGMDSFTYQAGDGQAESSPATVQITVSAAAVNSPPTGAEDAYFTPEDQPLSVGARGVLANDVDAEGDPLSAVLASAPRHGTLVLGSDGSFDYAPSANFHGTDSFSYLANDGQADSAPATVTITVESVNDAPVAADDSFSTPQDQALSVPAGGVLANDQDPDGDTLTAVLATGPANGTLTLNADGSLDYTPNPGFHGTDSFTYVANDGQFDSHPATVTVTVDPIGAPPAKELEFQLQVSGTAFGPDAGPVWGGSTFWVSAYVQDLREVPLGVVGGAIDVQFDAGHVSPTGNVVYGERFTDYRQGSIDSAAGLIDEAGALATDGGAGAQGMVPFVSWEFRRSGPGAPNDPNSRVTFAAEPGGGTGTIHPANFAMVGLGTPVDWANVKFDPADLSLSLGDFNHDGAVNQYDLALWIPHASSSLGDQRFDPQYDLNADARVDQGDLALLMPRLYQPVLSDAPPAPEGQPPAFVSTARVERPGSPIPSLTDDADLDWVASVAGRRHQRLGASPAKELAADRVFQAADCWRFA